VSTAAAPSATTEDARGYAAARESTALAELPGRGLLAVTGPQRVKFLQNILSNDVAARRPGQGVLAALMDVKGRLLAPMRVLVAEDAVLLEMPADRLDVVEPVLVHYKVAAPVRFARTPVVATAVLGPTARETLARAGVELPAEAAREDHLERSLAGVTVRVVRAGDLPAAGWVVHAPDESAAASVRAALAGAVPIGAAVLDTLRIEDGRPWYGPDIGEDHLLHETGLVAEYHSPSKGCYVGQEVIARLEARGAHVNKIVRGLRLEAPVSAGATIVAEDREVGRVTTAGVSPRLGAIAMGFVHRSAAEPGTAVRVDAVAGTVQRLPLAV
jgi:tRNA-modifying protein YgfZ